ncbi:restriction endonuclease [Helicobacter pylori]|uniref:restriction endonuclease n=1 Tax=Helicobacter pylori TaxID=210 RepID=UPI0039E1BB5A
MSEISTYKLIKEKLQAIPNQHLKGSWFEKVSKRFLKEHDSADEYESIDLWSDWELNNNERDRGIDMVITTTSKEYIAVQCKFHQDSVSLNDIATFLSKLQSGVGEVGFKKGIIISTSNLSSNALEEIEQIKKSKGIDIVKISEEDFIYSQAWLMKPLLEKKSKSLGAMTTIMMKQIKTMKSRKKTKQIKQSKIPNKLKKPFLTLSYCKI